jgi:hypothetical protein
MLWLHCVSCSSPRVTGISCPSAFALTVLYAWHAPLSWHTRHPSRLLLSDNHEDSWYLGTCHAWHCSKPFTGLAFNFHNRHEVGGAVAHILALMQLGHKEVSEDMRFRAGLTS